MATPRHKIIKRRKKLVSVATKASCRLQCSRQTRTLMRLFQSLQPAISLLALLATVLCRLSYHDLGVQLFSQSEVQALVRNQHIVMVGDSLMRYQYLSFVYLIHTGALPIHLEEKLLLERMHSSWADFYKYSNNVFNGSEFCDCYRDEPFQYKISRVYENRYYRDREQNISVTFLQYFGDTNPLEGTSVSHTGLSHKPSGSVKSQFRPYNWSYNNVRDLLTEYAAKLVPIPTVVILNAGHHVQNYSLSSHRESVLDAAKSHFPRVVWKTTSARRTHLHSSSSRRESEVDALVCAYPGIDCLNLNWTYTLLPEEFVDPVHFVPHVYADISVQLLRLLKSKESAPMYSTLPGDLVGSVISVADGARRGERFYADGKGRLRRVVQGANSGPCGLREALQRCPQHMRSTAWLLPYVTSAPLIDDAVCEGHLVRAAHERSIYLIEGGRRREFTSFKVFAERGYDVDQVKVLTDNAYFEIYSRGDGLL